MRSNPIEVAPWGDRLEKSKSASPNRLAAVLLALWQFCRYKPLGAFGGFIVVGLLLSGVIIRLVRINVIQAMKGDYVEAARARGIPERQVVRNHAFRNALVPVITVTGLLVASTISSALVTERTFNWPGLGTELVQYITARDYIAVQGLVTFFAVVVVLVSVVVDIIHALVDPRVRY